MMNRFFRKRGQSATEYMALIVFLLWTLLSFSPYIRRGFSGRWKLAGDSYGVGKQFDPRDYGSWGNGWGTLECFWDESMGKWVVTRCYEELCDCTLPYEDPDWLTECAWCKDRCSEQSMSGYPGAHLNYFNRGHNQGCRNTGAYGCAWNGSEWICT